MAALRRRHRRLRGLRILAFVFLLGIAYLLLLALRIYAEGKRDDAREPSDVIIVLGAAQYAGRPSPVYRARLDHALALYQAGYAPHLLFTGGRKPGDPFTEAQVGGIYARQRGVPASAILLEPDGRTTLQSLRACVQILRAQNLQTVILVSDPFHAFRLRRMAHDLGMRAGVSPVAHSRVRSLRAQSHFIMREIGVYALYRLFGV